MFSANSDVSTMPDIRRSIRKAPRIENTPITSGIAAATTPRKTTSSSTARIGKAISSALVRSSRVWSLTSLNEGANPPIRTSRVLGASRRLASSAASPPSSSMSWVDRWPDNTSERPSRAISARPSRRSRSGLTTLPTCSVRRSSRARRPTSRLTAGLRTSSRPWSRARTSSTMPGCGVVAEPVAQLLGGPLALGGAVGEPGGLEVAFHVVPEHARDHHEGEHHRQHRLRPLPGQVGDALEHEAAGRYQSKFL